MEQKTVQNKRIHFLPVIAAVVMIAAVAVTVISKSAGKEDPAPSDSQVLQTEPSVADLPAESNDLVIQASQIHSDASFFDYDAGGITVQVFAVQASDGTIRLALNTCQVCNGSPYAYFEQDGDDFVCQNCGNRFASTQIGSAGNGCSPVPIPESSYTIQGDSIIIASDYLDTSASRLLSRESCSRGWERAVKTHPSCPPSAAIHSM